MLECVATDAMQGSLTFPSLAKDRLIIMCKYIFHLQKIPSKKRSALFVCG